MSFVRLICVAIAIGPFAGLKMAAVTVAGETVEAKRIASFSLKDFRGKTHALSDLKESKLVVVAFLGTECPLVKLYGPRLAKLATEFEPQGVAFWGINANTQDSVTEIAAYARLHDIAFPLLKDLGNVVADQFGAERTPEVFVLDQKREIRYRGRIDDQFGVGYTRDEPKRNDLRIAIEELLAEKPVAQATTEAAGCHIGRVQVPKSDSTVTYSNQIARILNRRCVECHREGEIAPFSLTNYDEVVGWAQTIAEVVDQGRMPPWHADPAHGKFAEDRRLSADERQLLARWVENGAPQGDPAELPESPQFPATGWQLPQVPDAVFAMSEKPHKVPATGAVRYQFFRVNPRFTEDKWISAVEVVPGNRAVVHHVLVMARHPLTLGDPEDGGARGFLAAYVPGLRTAPYPAGMAKRITAGSQLIFQVHYTPNGSEQFDCSKIGFVFADPETVKHEIHTTSAVGHQIRIPPGADNHRMEAYSQTSPAEVQLLAMMPHMHLRGKSFKYEAVFPDKRIEVLLDVPHYDFNWQTAYRLAESRTLPAGTRMHCIAHFDNSENNLNNPDPTKTVTWGSQTWEEMMIGYFDIAVPRDPKSKESFTETSKENPVGESKRERGAALMKLLDRNKDGKIARDEVPERLKATFDRFDRDKSDDLTLEELQQGLETSQ